MFGRRRTLPSSLRLEITAGEMRHAFEALPKEERAACMLAARASAAYPERQEVASWSYREQDGSEFGQQVTPLDGSALYVPGGRGRVPVVGC